MHLLKMPKTKIQGNVRVPFLMGERKEQYNGQLLGEHRNELPLRNVEVFFCFPSSVSLRTNVTR